MSLAPIILFTYNRLDCLIKTVQHLQTNELAGESDLIIFSDGPKKEGDVDKVNKVREFLHTIKGFKTITINEAKKNQGLANSVISGVSKVLETRDKVIVVEDDLVTSTDFLRFMNDTLDFYSSNQSIWSVSGYCPPVKIPKDYPHDVYLTLRPSSWGWGTWKNRWEKIDWNVEDYEMLYKDKKKQREFNKGGNDLFGMLERQMNSEIDSWAIRWAYNQFRLGCHSVYPVRTRIKHIGIGKDATHVKKEMLKQNELTTPDKLMLEKNIVQNKAILRRLKRVNMTVVRRELRNIALRIGVYGFLYKIFSK